MSRSRAWALLPVAAILVAVSASESAVPRQTPQAIPSGPPKAEVLRAAADVMRRARYATLVTIGAGGQPEARIVDPLAPDSALTVWVGTNPRTRKVSEIARDARVTLMYFDATSNEYVSLVGRAEVVRYTASRRRYWKPDWAPFYPKGALSEDFVLLRVRPTRLEIVSPRHKLVSDSLTWRPVTVTLP